MSFRDVQIEWDGNHLTIPAGELFQLGARVEDVITIWELSDQMAHRRINVHRLADALGEILRWAGVQITNEQVYVKMWLTKGGINKSVLTAQFVLETLIPPGALEQGLKDGTPPQGNGRPAVASSSSKRTRSRSAAGG